MAAASKIQQEFPELAAQIVEGTLDVSSLRLPMCLSGACNGADETFGELAKNSAHALVHFLGPQDEQRASERAKLEQSDCFYHLSKELLDDPVIAKSLQVASTRRVLGSQRNEGWEERLSVFDVRRNFFQVHVASAVYVVGWRIAPGKDTFTGYSAVGDGETPVLDIGGRTGWACQCYLDRFIDGGENPDLCQLYFYDDAGPPGRETGPPWALRDEATLGKWSSWDLKSQRWVPMTRLPPRPSGLYVGIGARRLSESGRAVIRALCNESAMQLEFPELAAQIVNGTLDVSCLRLPMCLSGACYGADETFGAFAKEAGHVLVHFLGPDDQQYASPKARSEQSECFYHVPAELLDGPAVSEAFHLASIHRVLGSQRSEGWEARVAQMAARRNFLQVRFASSVYVVGWRLAPAMDQFTGRSPVEDDEAPALDIGGGTGWACQWYVNRFIHGGEDFSNCRLYFFDDAGPPWARRDKATMGKWSSWDLLYKEWIPLPGLPPRPSGLYAGIGATRLSESAAASIRALYSEFLLGDVDVEL